MVSLGQTANEAVTKFTPETAAEKPDGESNNDDNDLIYLETHAIDTLVLQIASWTHVQPPKH